MERKHKIYLIISSIVYFVLYFTYKIAVIKEIPLQIYQVYNYVEVSIIVLALFFGVRDNVRALVIWIGIVCGDLLLYLHNVLISIFRSDLIDIDVLNFAFIIIAIIFGFKSLTINTIDSDNFSKIYRKLCISFFIVNILLSALMTKASIEHIWDITSARDIEARIFYVLNNSLNFAIPASAMVIAILKITKRRTFGFVFSAILLVWHFFYYIRVFLSGGSFGLALAFNRMPIDNKPIFFLPPKVFLYLGEFIFILLLLFSLILIINFLFYLKRDPELIEAKDNAV